MNYKLTEIESELLKEHKINPSEFFYRDLGEHFNMNDGIMSRGIYNILVSTRDLKLWAHGMKPHRNWYVSDVKTYFGIKGNKDKLVKQIEILREVFL